MTTLLVFTFSTILGALYFYISIRDEDRRQEWRRKSRASWSRGQLNMYLDGTLSKVHN